jgi:mono/diheme cytochrome c family protein
MTRCWALSLLLAAPLWSQQNLQQVIAQGEKLFNQTCATGYCHALRGGLGGGAPRLAARSFDESYINTTTARGVAGTAMPAFAAVLSRAELASVVAYVATLNGIAMPNLNPGGSGAPASQPLPAPAERGRELFFDTVRSFGRCSTCHQVNAVGIPVASPIAMVPADVTALRALLTPGVSTAKVDGESMPALIVSAGKARTVFYDLTSEPPVQRTTDSSSVTIAEGAAWRHASVLRSYSDGELESILIFLRAATHP